MKTILDIGNEGAEYMDVDPPQSIAVEGVQRFTPIIDQFPTTTVEAEVNDGTRWSVEVHTLLLSNQRVFGLAREMALYAPMVFAQQGQRRVMGMLSPNFDEEGINRLPTLKVLPLETPYPLIARGSDLLPDANMATMLAGSARTEGKGSGGNCDKPEKDLEHRWTGVGALSLGKTTIVENGVHIQHAVRKKASVATGLTDGSLGDIYAPDGDRTGGFTGYGMPLVFEQGAMQPTDAIYFPKGFLHSQEAYGTHYTEAPRIAYGAGLQIMHQRIGHEAVSAQLREMVKAA